MQEYFANSRKKKRKIARKLQIDGGNTMEIQEKCIFDGIKRHFKG